MSIPIWTIYEMANAFESHVFAIDPHDPTPRQNILVYVEMRV